MCLDCGSNSQLDPTFECPEWCATDDLTLVPGYEFDTDMLRFTYSSPTTPARVYDYDMKMRGRELRKEQEIPSGHAPEAYICRRLLAESHDGTMVPVTVLLLMLATSVTGCATSRVAPSEPAHACPRARPRARAVLSLSLSMPRRPSRSLLPRATGRARSRGSARRTRG